MFKLCLLWQCRRRSLFTLFGWLRGNVNCVYQNSFSCLQKLIKGSSSTRSRPSIWSWERPIAWVIVILVSRKRFFIRISTIHPQCFGSRVCQDFWDVIESRTFLLGNLNTIFRWRIRRLVRNRLGWCRHQRTLIGGRGRCLRLRRLRLLCWTSLGQNLSLGGLAICSGWLALQFPHDCKSKISRKDQGCNKKREEILGQREFQFCVIQFLKCGVWKKDCWYPLRRPRVKKTPTKRRVPPCVKLHKYQLNLTWFQPHN